MSDNEIEIDDDMPDELNFSKLGPGVRGLHYIGPDVKVTSPANPKYITLDPTIREWLAVKAASKGVTPEALANDLLKRDMEFIEAMGETLDR